MKSADIPRKVCIQIIVICILDLIMKLNAARILAVFPAPSVSHQYVFRPLAQELAKRGHNVTVITTDPAYLKGQSPTNLTEIDVHDVSYRVWREVLDKVKVGNECDMEAEVDTYIQAYHVITERQLFTKEVQELITNKEIYFDLVITEACVQSSLIYSHIFKAPTVLVSSFGPMIGTNAVIGASNHPLFQPIIVRQRVFNLTLWETIREVYRQFKFEYNNYVHKYEKSLELQKTFGSNTPSLDELLNNIEMVFINLQWIWNRNSPVPQSLIHMGGLHHQTANELPEDLLSYLDTSKNGIIYVSFGTNVQPSMLTPKVVQIMIKVLSELPYNVIWKWNTDLPNKPNNIRVFKWLPQPDLLRHPNLKLFIMQGGLQSTDEAIIGGVPLIGIPVISDQWQNTEKFVHLGIGKQLILGAFTERDFKSAVVTVIADESYGNNILRLRTLYLDQPQPPLERTVRWVEHVLRHGDARHLRCSAANMSWTEYYELELIFIVLVCFVTIISMTLIILRYLFTTIFFKIILPSTNHLVRIKLS